MQCLHSRMQLLHQWSMHSMLIKVLFIRFNMPFLFSILPYLLFIILFKLYKWIWFNIGLMCFLHNYCFRWVIWLYLMRRRLNINLQSMFRRLLSQKCSMHFMQYQSRNWRIIMQLNINYPLSIRFIIDFSVSTFV